MQQVNWRKLFNAIRIDWRDRGRNCSSNHVNICCPWCHDDPSFHLTIDERTHQYYCFRDPRHSGANPFWILRALDKSTNEATYLLNDFSTSNELETPTSQRVRPHHTSDAAKASNSYWENIPLATDDICLNYLASRGFSNPKTVVVSAGLRFKKLGSSAWRILFPLEDAQSLQGWTGRAISSSSNPKYLTACLNADKCVYGSPNLPRLILVEGPMDALKINSAQLPGLGAIAILGKQVTAGRFNLIKHFHPTEIYISLDSDASLGQVLRLQEELSKIAPTRRRPIPEGYKDAGDLPEPIARDWLMAI